MDRGDIIGEGLAWVSLIGVFLLGRFFLNYIRDCEHIQERRQKEKEKRLAPKMRGDKPYWWSVFSDTAIAKLCEKAKGVAGPCGDVLEAKVQCEEWFGVDLYEFYENFLMNTKGEWLKWWTMPTRIRGTLPWELSRKVGALFDNGSRQLERFISKDFQQ